MENQKKHEISDLSVINWFGLIFKQKTDYLLIFNDYDSHYDELFMLSYKLNFLDADYHIMIIKLRSEVIKY